MSCLFSKTNGFKSLSLKNPPDLPLYKGPKRFMGCFEGGMGGPTLIVNGEMIVALYIIRNLAFF